MKLDMFTGSFVASGYRIVFDRHPRNFARASSREEVLRRMSLCDYFVAILSEGYSLRAVGEDLANAGAATHEWEQALKLARFGPMRLIGIWYSGGGDSAALQPRVGDRHAPIHGPSCRRCFASIFRHSAVQTVRPSSVLPLRSAARTRTIRRRSCCIYQAGR